MSNDNLRRLREWISGTSKDKLDGATVWGRLDHPVDRDPGNIVARDVRRLIVAGIDKLLAEPEPESEPAPTDPERALLGWVADNCGLTVAQEAELARRLESLRQPAPATDAETQQELSDLHAELDEVRDERNEARAELARLRAGGCARDQTTTQFCAEAVALQRENERLRAELAAKGGS